MITGFYREIFFTTNNFLKVTQSFQRPSESLASKIYHGNRTEGSLIRSVIIRVINEITRESDLFNHEYDYRQNWTKRSSVTNLL